MINATGLKRLKRRRKLWNRFKCHGSNYSCIDVHPYGKPPVYATPMPERRKIRTGFFGSIVNWFKGIFTDNRDVKY